MSLRFVVPRATPPALPRLGFPRSRASSPVVLHVESPQRQQQHRHASILGSLSDNRGAYNKRIRRGRGPASGKGKTSGRGHGGQKQHGKVPFGFNGGQSKDEVVAGRRGGKNNFALDMAKVNLDKIQAWIDAGRVDATKPITLRELHSSRLTHGIKDGVKLLARNGSDLKTPIHITVSRASAAAIAAVEAVGGTVQTRYYTRPSIRRILAGNTHPTLSLLSQPESRHLAFSSEANASVSVGSEEHELPSTAPAKAVEALRSEIRRFRYRLPDPASRKDLEYYRDPAHRGYLSYQLREGEGPSLFFRSPTETLARVRGAGRKKGDRKTKADGGKLW